MITCHAAPVDMQSIALSRTMVFVDTFTQTTLPGYLTSEKVDQIKYLRLMFIVIGRVLSESEIR